MPAKPSAQYVQETLAVQGCSVEAADAAVMAVTLAAQLEAAHADYESLSFEVEPAHFDVAIRQGAIR
ncbi:MAG: hypothetical protein ACKODB_07165 [Betaproteobacteria bacterium]